MGWSSIVYVKGSIRWCSGKSVQIEDARVRATQKRIGIERHGDSSKDIDVHLSKSEDNGEEECRSETSITKFWRQARENRNRSSGQKPKGLNWRWRRKRYVLPVERKWPVFEGTIVHKNRHRKPPTHSEPSMSRGRSMSRKSSVRGKSNHGAILRQVCRYYLKGTCTRSPCEYWHPPECQFYKTESSCKAGDTCLFSHHKVDEQPKRKPPKEPPFPQRKRKRRQKCCSYCENCTNGYDSLSLRYVKRVSRKRKDHRLEKYKSKFLISEVPTLWNLRTGPMKRRPKQGMESCQKHLQAQRERQGCIAFYSPAEEWVLPAASTKEPEEREFVVDSGASMHMVSKTDLNSAVGDHEDIEKSDDGDDGQRRGANKRRSHGMCQRIGLIREGYASWTNSRSPFSREALRGSRVYLPLDQRSKNHISPKMARELIAM